MVCLLRKLAFVCSFACALLLGAAQEQTPPPVVPSDPAYEFFSGTIAEAQAGKITVERAVLGKPAETRSFLVTSETKVEGTLKVKERVTVGFKVSEEGDVAVRIIVREQPKKKR